MSERTETYNEPGLFKISEEAGETIEANTQIVLQEESRSKNYTVEYSYEDAVTGSN